MYTDVLIAGFGGQGVLLIGNLLAHSAMQQGLHVTYMPVYGVEMRGGTANCTVVVSEDEIGSPVVHNPRSLIIMNQPSLEKFQPRLIDGGRQIVNTSIVDPSLVEDGRISSFQIPANEIANELGNTRFANMVALGAWLQATEVITMKSVLDSLHNVISGHNINLIPKNQEAIQAGAAYVKDILELQAD